MKRVLLLLLASVTIGGLAASSLAQPPLQKQPAKPATKAPAVGSIEWMRAIHTRVVNTLGLTAAQKKSIIAAFEKQTTLQMKLQKDYPYKGANDPNNKKRSDAMTKASNTFKAEAKKALGAKYEPYLKKLQEEFSKEAAKMGMGGMTPAKIEAAMKKARATVAKQMALTPAQIKSIGTIEAKAQKDSMAFSTKMAGKDFSKMSKAEKDKLTADSKKIYEARLASLKKLLGDKKALDYDKRLQAEMQKEMTKLMPKPPAAPKKSA